MRINPDVPFYATEGVYIQLAEEFRRKGIGKRVTAQLMALLKQVGVHRIVIDAGLDDGAYAWAKAGFKFGLKPVNVIRRLEGAAHFVNDKKLNSLIERLNTLDVNSPNYPMPKEVLDLKTNWKKYISAKDLEDTVIKTTMGMRLQIPQNPVHLTQRFDTNARTLGELILRRSNWTGYKDLNKVKFANGGIVPKAAVGGLLINGRFFGGFSGGGMVPSYLAQGGYAMGTDTVPAMLTPGEFVVKKSAVDRIGVDNLAKINGYADGGLVGGLMDTATAAADSVYNYSINVNVSTDANPEQIAYVVLSQIKRIDDMRVRGIG